MAIGLSNAIEIFRHSENSSRIFLFFIKIKNDGLITNLSNENTGSEGNCEVTAHETQC